MALSDEPPVGLSVGRSDIDARWRRTAGVVAVSALVVALFDNGDARLGLVLPLLVVPTAVLLIQGFVVAIPLPVLIPVVVAGPTVLLFLNAAEGGMFLVAIVALLVVHQLPNRHVALALSSSLVLIPAVAGVTVDPDAAWGFWCLGIALAASFGHLGRQNRELLVRLEASRREAADRAVLAERRRIAGDIHDLVGHSLSVVLLHITGARRAVRCDPASAEQALESAETVGRTSLAEIRRSVGLLRTDDPAGVLPSPDASDVSRLVDDSVAAGQSVTYLVDGDLTTVTGGVGLTVYRLVQESLANAAKHAPGASVDIAITVTADSCSVCVENPLGPVRPVAAPGGGGYGLIGMRERVQAAGGTLVVGPAGPVWRVDAAVPLHATAVGS